MNQLWICLSVAESMIKDCDEMSMRVMMGTNEDSILEMLKVIKAR